jgi:hypothetical protein
MILHSCCHLGQVNVESEVETKAVKSVKNGGYFGPNQFVCRLVMLAVATIQKVTTNKYKHFGK